MKRRILSLLLCFTLLGTTVGCGIGSASSTGTESGTSSSEKGTATGAKTKLTFWYADADGMKDYVAKGMAERFMKAYPRYELECTSVPGTAGDYETKFNSAKMSGTLPDLCYLTLTSFASLGTRGEFLSMEDNIKSWSDKDDFLPSALNMGKIEGKYTGIGVAPAPAVFVYRSDMFKTAGLDPEKPPANWEELAQDAEKLTIKDNKGNIVQCGLDIPSIDKFHNISEPFMLMNGATVVDEVKMQPHLDDPKVVESLNYLYNIYKKGVTLPYDWQKPETIPFLNGVSAMSFISVDNYKKLLENKPELKNIVRIAPPISNKQPAAFCGYRLITATAGTKDAAGAWDFMKFFLQSDEIETRLDASGVVPVRRSLQSKYVEKMPTEGKDILKTVEVGKGAFVVPWVSTLYKYYGPAYESIMQGKATSADAMAQAQKGILSEIGN